MKIVNKYCDATRLKSPGQHMTTLKNQVTIVHSVVKSKEKCLAQNNESSAGSYKNNKSCQTNANPNNKNARNSKATNTNNWGDKKLRAMWHLWQNQPLQI